MTGLNIFVALMVAVIGAGLASAGTFVTVPDGEFSSVIPQSQTSADTTVKISSFDLEDTPVTNAEFLQFVLHRPQWQRGEIPGVYADDAYLQHWESPINLGHADPDQPVTQISWFAAKAYCEYRKARLPTWNEWEYAAAADETSADARMIPAWRQKILSWYERTGRYQIAKIRMNLPNFYGIYDLHGIIWEWVDDFSALLVSGDSREQNGADKLKFCGAGALALENKDNYAILMRIAMLSSVEAKYTTRNLGFRCTRSTD